MTEFTKFTSGFNVGGENVGIQAAKVEWDVLSGLTATSASSATSGIMTPDQIQGLVASQIATVYKVKGTLNATVTEGAITNMPTDAENGDVYNIALPEGVAHATLDGQTITNGDNVVYVKDQTKWDKLAGAIDTTTFATKEWVNDEYSATRNAVSSTSANWDTAYDEVTGAVTTSAGMADTANTAKLAQVGAITGYIEDKISETIAETIDIAETITTATPTSAIPNVGALTGYVDGKNYVQSGFVAAKVFKDATDAGSTFNTTGHDTIAFSAGNNITLAATADSNGNPTIVINAADQKSFPSITATNGVTAEAKTDTDGAITAYSISGVDATTAAAGITKAAYYEESTGLIHLF